MGHRGGPASGAHGASRVVGAAAALLVATTVFVAALPAEATRIEVDKTISVGYFVYVELNNPGIAGDWHIDAAWTSSTPIDVYVLSSYDYGQYKAGNPFSARFQASGTSGDIKHDVLAADRGQEPLYLVFDHSAIGPTKPSGNAQATISVTGLTFPSGSEAGGGSIGGMVAAVVGLAVLLVIVAVVAVVVVKRRSDARAAEASAQAAAAAGLGYAVATGPGAPAGPGPQMTGPRRSTPDEPGPQPPPGQQTVEVEPGYCVSCGKLIGERVCPHCGANQW